MRASATARRAAAVVAVLGLGLLTGCSGDDDGADPEAAATSDAVPTYAPGEAVTLPDGTVVTAGPDGTLPDPGAGDGSPGDGSGTAGEDADETDPEAPDDGEPGSPDSKGRQTDVFDRIDGDPDGDTCVDVGERRDVRSGGFVAGAFDDARAGYGTERPGFDKREVRVYFVPLHAGSMPDPRIRVSGPGGARGDVRRVTDADTEQWRFYDTTIRLPRGGTWTLRVSTAKDTGCFRVTL